uniref:alpha-1,2-Mannosidase n=1 Tax=Macrostomum lignano TaxID=282301 RepID=A0A1I8F7A2_9PLAT
PRYNLLRAVSLGELLAGIRSRKVCVHAARALRRFRCVSRCRWIRVHHQFGTRQAPGRRSAEYRTSRNCPKPIQSPRPTQPRLTEPRTDGRNSTTLTVPVARQQQQEKHQHPDSAELLGCRCKNENDEYSFALRQPWLHSDSAAAVFCQRILTVFASEAVTLRGKTCKPSATAITTRDSDVGARHLPAIVDSATGIRGAHHSRALRPGVEDAPAPSVDMVVFGLLLAAVLAYILLHLASREAAPRNDARFAWRGYLRHLARAAVSRKRASTSAKTRARTRPTILVGAGAMLTAVDSLDTLLVMGLGAGVPQARDPAAAPLPSRLDNSSQVSVFETTIRMLGGLLGAYSLTEDPIFARKAANSATAWPEPLVAWARGARGDPDKSAWVCPALSRIRLNDNSSTAAASRRRAQTACYSAAAEGDHSMIPGQSAACFRRGLAVRIDRLQSASLRAVLARRALTNTWASCADRARRNGAGGGSPACFN